MQHHYDYNHDHHDHHHDHHDHHHDHHHFHTVAHFEHRFWLQVLGDHARFILDALAPDEVEEIEQAHNFVNIFDSLLNRARQPLHGAELHALTTAAQIQAQEIREFKLNLIQQHLVGDITIELPPTFLNHMVNEVDEYLRILRYLVAQQIPPVTHPVHHHLLWLLDAEGHAVAIHDSLDPVEQKLRMRSQIFTKHFDDYYDKVVEMAGFLRTTLTQFPALSRFNKQVDLEIRCFMGFLLEIQELEMQNKVLGTLTPLLPDHMFREECYFLTKLAQVSDIASPECDPTQPRVEDPEDFVDDYHNRH